jgi:hypothetical protein
VCTASRPSHHRLRAQVFVSRCRRFSLSVAGPHKRRALYGRGRGGYSLRHARNSQHVATFLACSACVARASANLSFCPESWPILCMRSRNTPVSCWWCEHNWAPRVASLLGKRHLFKRMLKGSAMQAMSHVEDPSESATVWLAFLLCGGAGCTKLRHPLGKSQQKCLCIKGAGWCQNPCPRHPRAARRF